jgi:spore germination cell wall hydrolase CwlJ-like protein
MLDLPPAQTHCLAQVIYLEARGESTLGQRAVAHVVINRSKKTGKPICAVIKQPGQFQVKFRSSYFGYAWDNAVKIARSPGIDITKGSLYFKSKSSRARWNLKHMTSIGNHSFYK